MVDEAGHPACGIPVWLAYGEASAGCQNSVGLEHTTLTDGNGDCSVQIGSRFVNELHTNLCSYLDEVRCFDCFDLFAWAVMLSLHAQFNTIEIIESLPVESCFACSPK